MQWGVTSTVHNDLGRYPFVELSNLVFCFGDDSVLALVDTEENKNQPVWTVHDHPDWDPKRAPDLLLSKDVWWEYFKTQFVNSKVKWDDIDLFTFYHRSDMINGPGNYIANEVCDRLYSAFGVPPWTSLQAFTGGDCSSTQFAALIVFYERFVLDTLHTHEQPFAPSKWNSKSHQFMYKMFCVFIAEDIIGTNKSMSSKSRPKRCGQ